MGSPQSPHAIFLLQYNSNVVLTATLSYCPYINICLDRSFSWYISTATMKNIPGTKFRVQNTLASASKRVALTPGVLAILRPTAARMLQLWMTSTWKIETKQIKTHNLRCYPTLYMRQMFICDNMNRKEKRTKQLQSSELQTTWPPALFRTVIFNTTIQSSEPIFQCILYSIPDFSKTLLVARILSPFCNIDRSLHEDQLQWRSQTINILLAQLTL